VPHHLRTGGVDIFWAEKRFTAQNYMGLESTDGFEAGENHSARGVIYQRYSHDQNQTYCPTYVLHALDVTPDGTVALDKKSNLADIFST
jgi:hypothetical protein